MDIGVKPLPWRRFSRWMAFYRNLSKIELPSGTSISGLATTMSSGQSLFGDDEMIRFAFKMTIWGFLGLMILPSLVPADEAGATATADAETSIHAARFAGAVAEDMGSLCTRQPALCESGRALADAALARAHQGLVIAAGFIERAQAGDEAAQSPQEGA